MYQARAHLLGAERPVRGGLGIEESRNLGIFTDNLGV